MRKRFSESEIIHLLRAIEVKISGGMRTQEACRSLGVSDKSYYRWRKLYGSSSNEEPDCAQMRTTPMSRGKPNGTGRNGAKLTWAVGANGEITNIFEAKNGLKCACTCPACGGALIAKQGKTLEHHFAHASGDECRHAVETALHLAAKNILAVRKELVLPAIKIPSVYTRPHSKNYMDEHSPELAPQRRYSIGSVAVEHRLGSIIPDVIVGINGRELLVEVTVTHGIDRDKLRRIRDLGVSCLEIDLSGTDRGLTREELEKIVVDGIAHKRWLYNVRAEERGRRRLSEGTLLFSVPRGFAWHVDGCPIPARTWRGKSLRQRDRRLHGM